MTEVAPTLRCEVQDDPPRVRVFGEVDLDTVDVLTEAVRPLLHADHDHPVTFDLAQVTFLDSSGLSVLVRTANVGKGVIIENPSVVVRKIILATGLGDQLGVDP